MLARRRRTERTSRRGDSHREEQSMTEAGGAIRVGLIGCGGIGRPVARALLRGAAGPHALTGLLARSARDLDGFPVAGDPAAFLARDYDLIVEAGGPAAFRALVPAALERADVWAVSPIPLADP